MTTFKSFYNFTAPVLAPDTPTGLSVVVGAPSSTVLDTSWNASATATGYKLYRDGIFLIDVGNVLVYSDTGLTDTTTYSYQVLAYNTGGESALSAGVNGTTTEVQPLATATPIDFISTCSIFGSGDAFTVDWGDGNPISYADGDTASAVPTGSIIVDSLSLTHIQFKTNTFSAIDLTNATTLTSLFKSFQFLTALTSFAATSTGNITNFSFAWDACNSLTSFPLIDTSSGTNFEAAWYRCAKVPEFPLIDISSGTNFKWAWRSCEAFTSFPLIDTSSGTDFDSSWRRCLELTSFPLIDTSNGTNFESTFDSNPKLASIPAINTIKGTNFVRMVSTCDVLVCMSSVNTSLIGGGSSTTDMFSNTPALTAPTASEQTQILSGFNYINPDPCP